MSYVKVFETDDKSEFREACAILRKESIKHEVMYEYRLYREKRYDSLESGGAEIRVPRSVFHDADRLLFEKGLKRNQEDPEEKVALISIINRLFPQISTGTRVLLTILMVALIILAMVLLIFGLLRLAISLD